MYINPLLIVELMKIFTYSVGRCFVWLMVSFALLFSLMRSHWLIVDLVSLSVFCWEHHLLCRRIQGYTLTFSSIRFCVSGFMLKALICWSWVLCRLKSVDLFIFLYMQPSTLIIIICWRCCLVFFPQCVFLVYQNSGVHICVDWCLVLQLHSTHQRVCFYANIMLFSLR